MYHYSVIKSINSTTVVLADSSLGIITVTMEEFIELFGSSGYVLVVSKSEINGSVNGTVLTRDQMKSINWYWFGWRFYFLGLEYYYQWG